MRLAISKKRIIINIVHALAVANRPLIWNPVRSKEFAGFFIAKNQEVKMGVHLSSHTNSTLFTDCCDVAICDDQSVCPHCKKEVEPREPRLRWEEGMRRLYGSENLRKMREKYRNW